MSQENLQGTTPRSYTAGGTILRGQTVKFSATAKTVVATTAITDIVIGVALQGASSGEQVPCACVPGTLVTMISGGSVSAGAELMPQATGPGKVVTSSGATAKSCGIALTDGTTDGDLFEAIYLPTLKSPANS